MAPPKEFLCKNCGDIHKRPINSKCQFPSKTSEDNHVSDDLPVHSENTSDLNMQILAVLKSLGGRMSAMEDKMASK